METNMYVRAYFLYIFGCVVFPDTPKMTISCEYLQFLKDITKVNDYAWGVAMLAHMHSGLRRMKLKVKSGQGAKNFCGSCLALQFAAQIYGFGLDTLPHSFPLVKKWALIMIKKTRDNVNRIRVETIEAAEERVIFFACFEFYHY
ncbi:hypothetical protein Cni_G07188 [Canna indica]|uniref:Aminotransferase-like plant mobile domain-containing protein n=1 Tax=Canna indica TaxID=4628 RepID=A0AAQ3JYB7_9LILI|nr:hypothetical protein Cni_G07188 [Canna indica]